jgi:bifunctional DNA-binding transcriptional regulator/antitoxin component of YhaV-PrlF toxin-antitoxin module
VKTLGPYRLQKTFNVVTVPEEVRKVLGIGPGDVVVWVIDDTGQCILKRATIKIEEK